MFRQTLGVLDRALQAIKDALSVNGSDVDVPGGTLSEQGKRVYSPNNLGVLEEGSFTPVFEGRNTAGSHTYHQQQGRYRRIGDWVTIFLNIDIDVYDSNADGPAQIAGLPYVNTSLNSAYTAVPWGNYYIDSKPSNFEGIAPGVLRPGETVIAIRYTFSDNSREGDLSADEVGSAFRFRTTFTYYIGN